MKVVNIEWAPTWEEVCEKVRDLCKKDPAAAREYLCEAPEEFLKMNEREQEEAIKSHLHRYPFLAEKLLGLPSEVELPDPGDQHWDEDSITEYLSSEYGTFFYGYDIAGEKMKGYKVFNPDWTCQGFQYKVGETYTMKAVPVLYDRGFHFCERLADCFGYYDFDPNNKVAEVEAVGEVVSGDNGKISCTNMITIVRELTWEEVLRTVNTGKFCTGVGNSGNYDSGHGNSGHRNSGNWNSGDCNSGDLNSGNRNSGHKNSGHGNSGNWNCGNWNSGNGNIGDLNSGDYNGGNCNSGNWNCGDWNSGNWNCGDWNVTSFSAGCFCTEEPKILLFDRPSDLTLGDWRNSDARRLLNQIPRDGDEWYCTGEMTDEEKEAHPEHETTGGYLKPRNPRMHKKEVQGWWNSLSDAQREIIRSIPNFDPEIFKKCTGIDVGPI